MIYAWPFNGWDLSNYHTVLTEAYLPAFLRSLAFAALTTLLCLLIGYPVAYVIARYGGRVRHLLVVLLDPAVVRRLPDPRLRVDRAARRQRRRQRLAG